MIFHGWIGFSGKSVMHMKSASSGIDGLISSSALLIIAVYTTRSRDANFVIDLDNSSSIDWQISYGFLELDYV